MVPATLAILRISTRFLSLAFLSAIIERSLMAPPKKKVGNTSKADSNSSSSSTAAASTKQQITVSTRPKRHAEKRFYDDIEDERPQHLAAKSQRKKRGELIE